MLCVGNPLALVLEFFPIFQKAEHLQAVFNTTYSDDSAQLLVYPCHSRSGRNGTETLEIDFLLLTLEICQAGYCRRLRIPLDYIFETQHTNIATPYLLVPNTTARAFRTLTYEAAEILGTSAAYSRIGKRPHMQMVSKCDSLGSIYDSHTIPSPYQYPWRIQ
ncbi:hypothetical protein BGZ60DRAFT_115190 [Tricladium varicosporioides]|nr:hypothetical protein BGZ60DRAFT_115190 [Hymenoscyphus varicosporioides]